MTQYVSIVLLSVFIHWLLFAQLPVAYILLNIQEDHSKPSKLLVKKNAVVLLKMLMILLLVYGNLDIILAFLPSTTYYEVKLTKCKSTDVWLVH